jgi:hypothetical protein
MWCHCYPHHIAWYLTYGEWPTQEIDHIDRDPANNRLANLRSATHAQNSRNRRKKAGSSSSQYKGVVKVGPSRWDAYISKDGKRIYLGGYYSELEAAQAYDTAAQELHGEFACLNLRQSEPSWQRTIPTSSL